MVEQLRDLPKPTILSYSTTLHCTSSYPLPTLILLPINLKYLTIHLPITLLPGYITNPIIHLPLFLYTPTSPSYPSLQHLPATLAPLSTLTTPPPHTHTHQHHYTHTNKKNLPHQLDFHWPITLVPTYLTLNYSTNLTYHLPILLHPPNTTLKYTNTLNFFIPILLYQLTPPYYS